MGLELAVGAVLLALWSQDIGIDPPWPPEAPRAAAPTPEPFQPQRAPARPAGSRAPRGGLAPSAGPLLDARAFQAAFRRQASQALLPCLRDWRPPPSALGLTATLDASGQLTNVALLDPAQGLPGCAAAALAGMEFRALTRTLGRRTVTVQWRIDW